MGSSITAGTREKTERDTREDEILKEEERRDEDRRKWQFQMQKELKSQRQEHKLKLFQLQREKEEERKDEKRKLLDKIPCLTDSDQPEAYLARFDDLVRDAEIPKEDWCRRLQPLLTGKVLYAYSREIPEAMKQDYDKFKEALLNALGLTLPQCIEEFFRAEKKFIQEAIRSAEFASIASYRTVKQKMKCCKLS